MEIRISNHSWNQKGKDLFVRMTVCFSHNIPKEKLFKCSDAVDWMIKNWKGPGKMFAYSGTMFKRKDLAAQNLNADQGDETMYHAVAVLRMQNAYYIIDPTIFQFSPRRNINIQIIKIAPNDNCIVPMLQRIYGGRWIAF